MRHSLFDLFLKELTDIYDAEHEIINALPKLIKLASSSDLKEALTSHLKETKNQVKRIDQIFDILDIEPQFGNSKIIDALIKEASEVTRNQKKSPTLDAAIVGAAQKVEHYEIAVYGTLRSFAEQLDFESEIIDLLQDTLDEEAGADKKLTKLAEGSFFSGGINSEAAAELATAGGSSKKGKR